MSNKPTRLKNYETSQDYEKLYELFNAGNEIVADFYNDLYNIREVFGMSKKTWLAFRLEPDMTKENFLRNCIDSDVYYIMPKEE